MVCVYACKYVCMYVCMYVCIVRVYACVYVQCHFKLETHVPACLPCVKPQNLACTCTVAHVINILLFTKYVGVSLLIEM